MPKPQQISVIQSVKGSKTRIFERRDQGIQILHGQVSVGSLQFVWKSTETIKIGPQQHSFHGEGYKIVYRPRSISFQGVENFGVAPGFVFHLIGTDGQSAKVVYLMIKDEDEGWRIAGVQLFNIKGKII